MFAASIASKAAAGFWSQNAQIAHAANAVIPTTFLVFSFFFLGLKLSLVLASDSSPRWTDDDDTIDLGFVLFLLLAKLLRSEKEEEQNEFVEEHVVEKEENILISIDMCVCVCVDISISCEVFCFLVSCVSLSSLVFYRSKNGCAMKNVRALWW
jgi:hypothetical protein